MNRNSLLPLVMPVLASALVVAVLVVAAFPDRAATPQRPEGAAAPAAAGSVVVASANLREGSFPARQVDLTDSRDLRAFARRMVAQTGGGAAPDVVAVQEVHRSAGAVARALNQRLRAVGRPDRYRVLTRPRMTTSRRACGRMRDPGRHMVLRDTALLVNRATVRGVHGTGMMRTWGGWWEHRGCAEHPWARLSIERPGEARRTAVVLGVHLAPRGKRLKNTAMRRMPRFVERIRRDGDLAVLAGDFNLVRCPIARVRPKNTPCQVRPGHRALAAAGYVDTVRATRRAGPTPAGVQMRLDFIYTDARARSAWFDRCYLAFHASGCARGVFTERPLFTACQARHDEYGTPGGGCGRKAYRRYYSDHHFVLARVG